MRWHIAQMNVGTALHPLDDQRMAGFMGELDRINALAEASPGFVWRLKSDAGNATDIKLTDDPLFIVNMSVWESIDALFGFVYRSAHQGVMQQRRQWFAPPAGPYLVLWWIPAGTLPTPEEGLARLAHLAADGPSAQAFTFRRKFPPPGSVADPEDMHPEPYCVGWQRPA